MQGFSEGKFISPLQCPDMTIFVRLLKRQDRYVMISGIIIFSWLHWQKKVIWKKLKNIFPVPTEKCQVLISISAIIRLWTVYLDIIRIMQNKKVFLFWHRLIFQITFGDEMDICLVLPQNWKMHRGKSGRQKIPEERLL